MVFMIQNQVVHSEEEKIFLRSLGDRLRSLRKAKGLTQEKLANACGLHRTYLCDVERGKRNVSVINLRRIAEELGVKVGELFE